MLNIKFELEGLYRDIKRELEVCTSDEEQAMLFVAKANVLTALQKYED